VLDAESSMKKQILTPGALVCALSLFLGGCSNDSITSSSSSIRVTEPASSSAVTAGMISTIQWTVTGKADNTVAIDLYADTGFVQSIGSSVPNNGDFSWMVSSLVPGDSAYRIKVTSGSQASVFGFSGTFTVINNTDDYEPDNTPSQATSIDTSGIPQRHRISQSDTDWFTFDATGGRTYCIQTHGNAATCLWLYATNAITLLSSDNSGSGSGNNGLIVWTCVSSGTYYFKVTAPYQTAGEDYTVDGLPHGHARHHERLESGRRGRRRTVMVSVARQFVKKH
jgi:Ser-Thr-rich glycosyl-phosphatidyl-inositol-anchored membrane family